MVSEFPLAVWQGAVQHQEYQEECQEGNQHAEIDDIFRKGGNEGKLLLDVAVNPVSEYQQGQGGDDEQGENRAVECGKQSQYDEIAGFPLAVYGIESLDQGEECLGTEPDGADDGEGEDVGAAGTVDVMNQYLEKFMKGFRDEGQQGEDEGFFCQGRQPQEGE